jgi:MYXO-CTERM domain-containing protein
MPVGNYTASDFIVTSSTANPGLVGASVSGGQLVFWQDDTFHWDGSYVDSIGGGFGGIAAGTPDYQQGWQFHDTFVISGQVNKDGRGYGASYTLMAEESPTTPEPGSAALFAAGGLVALRQLRRRKR